MLTTSQIFIRLILSLVLGSIIGFFVKKEKFFNFEIYPLFSLGATILMILNQEIFLKVYSKIDLIFLPASLIIGLFFISQSLIKESEKISETLVSIGYLFATTLIGFVVGFGFYRTAIFTTLFSLIFTVVSPLIKNFYKK